VLPNTRVVLKNVDTSVERTAVSNSSGSYTFLNIPPGRYTMETSAAGFRTTTVSEFNLAVNQSSTIDIALEVGTLAQTLAIEARSSAIESQTSELGTVVSEKQVVDLPLNGRNLRSFSR